MTILMHIFILFCSLSSCVDAMDGDQEEEKKKYLSIIAKADANIKTFKKLQQTDQNPVNEAKYAQGLFDAFMQKGAAHFHCGERDLQLRCYLDILGTKGLPKLTLARTQVNISVIHLQLNRNLLAASHLKKAEELASIEELGLLMGDQIYGIFAVIYEKTASELYLDHPKQSLEYQKRALHIPQDELRYAQNHLQLAVLYDRLLDSKESLIHALQTLKCASIPTVMRNRAFCYASIGSAGVNNSSDCIRYFEAISAIDNLHKNEVHLLCSTVGSCYLSDCKWDKGFRLRHQAIDVLEPSSPQYLLGKHNLATAYGESGDKELELELYGEVLDGIKCTTFDQEWQETMQSTQMLIETAFFMRAMGEFEQQVRTKMSETAKVKEEESQERLKAEEQQRIKRKQEKALRKERSHQKMIEQIKKSQREAFEREQKLHDAKLKKAAEERQRAEERKARQSTTTKTPEEQILSKPDRYVPENKPPKVKTKRVAERAEAAEGQVQAPPAPILPTLPKMGVCAQGVFNQIDNEDWSFTREEYAHYLKDFHCLERQVDGSHRVFQLPKSSILTLKIDDQTVTEHIMWAQEDFKLGSVTLPAWKGKEIPFYLRKQLRSFHEKIVALYAKVTALGKAADNNSN